MPHAELHLVTGGARSGKSRYAERLARTLGGDHVAYLATLAPLDDEMRRRIRRHRARRPSTWTTHELTQNVNADAVTRHLAHAPAATILLDCLAGLISTVLLEHAPDDTAAQGEALAVADALAATGRATGKTLIVVTNEVGSGVVPATKLGRVYRDILGLTNQRLAARADTVTLLTAGLPLPLKGEPPQENA